VDQALYDALIAVACSLRPTVTYSDVALRCGLEVRADISELSRRLDEISRHEHNNGRPLLSVVVVHKDGDMMPGDGFFRLARSLGVQRTGVDNMSFFSQELRRCQEHWRGE
jgi:hypothetical protein